MNNKKDKIILNIIFILFVISIFIMGYLLIFCNLKEISNRVYINIFDYLTYIDNILLCLFFIIFFINAILMLFYTFKENKKEI